MTLLTHFVLWAPGNMARVHPGRYSLSDGDSTLCHYQVGPLQKVSDWCLGGVDTAPVSVEAGEMGP